MSVEEGRGGLWSKEGRREVGRRGFGEASHFHSKSLCCLTQGEFGCWVFGVCCRDPGDCFSVVPVWFGRLGFWKGFLVRGGRRWLSNTEEEVLRSGPDQGGKSSGRCDHD